VGSLEPGKWADIIAVPTDPMKDVRVLQQIPFVMKSGVVYRRDSQRE
jgi:imidazolonepropionase-like amidohydrolase